VTGRFPHMITGAAKVHPGRAFDGPLWVHYGQAYVAVDEAEIDELDSCFRGQQNGICGAAVPGTLFLITGLHTGIVGFSLDVLPAEPELDDEWEDIVEVSFETHEKDVVLEEWGGEGTHPFELAPGTYRVRYCGRGMDQGSELDTTPDDDTIVDTYALVFWPAPMAPDRIVRQSSENAAYWHDHAQGLTAG